jgi:hypothetical protein
MVWQWNLALRSIVLQNHVQCCKLFGKQNIMDEREDLNLFKSRFNIPLKGFNCSGVTQQATGMFGNLRVPNDIDIQFAP